MNIGVVGLGLIGGSIAKAFKTNTEHTVFAFDKDKSVVCKAKLVDAIDDILTEETLPLCDIVIIAVYPKATVEYVQKHKSLFKKGAMVFDTCGVKEVVCNPIWDDIKGYDFTFVGGHPMAGREFSGFDFSKQNLFTNAPMVLVPPKDVDIATLEYFKKLWQSIGFSSVQITTAEEHDKLIAFTSQLAHVVSSAYIKSPTALRHRGFSAGSYKDMTRVAKLNENMWTELFLDNKEALCEEIDSLCERLKMYSDAIKENDDHTLCKLLAEGCMAKAQAERRTKSNDN